MGAMVNRIVWAVCIILLEGCLDPYYPDVDAGDVSILVVDAALDTSVGSATVDLSRALPLSEPDSFPRVVNAFVAIEDGLGNQYALTDQGTGRYVAENIPVYTGAVYRLHVITPGNDEYFSDPVTAKDTQPIDSVTWTTDSNKLTVMVTTHDDTNQSRYYRWTYEETWNYHAAVLSLYTVVNKTITERKFNEIPFYCWKTEESSDIVIGSTARLSADVVNKAPVKAITVGSSKFQTKYSILVKQRAISEDEYNYLEALRKTTESIGGLFDPQPIPVTGNISRVRAGSPLAVGYFGAGHTVKSRIFIANAELPAPFRQIYPLPGCLPPDTVCASPNASYQCALHTEDLISGEILGVAVDNGAAYTLTDARCGDCRWQGGVLNKPDFWE